MQNQLPLLTLGLGYAPSATSVGYQTGSVGVGTWKDALSSLDGFASHSILNLTSCSQLFTHKVKMPPVRQHQRRDNFRIIGYQNQAKASSGSGHKASEEFQYGLGQPIAPASSMSVFAISKSWAQNSTSWDLDLSWPSGFRFQSPETGSRASPRSGHPGRDVV